MIKKLFLITFFINLTIPKAGMYLHKGKDIRVPVTLGYVIFLLLFLVWLISNRKRLGDIFFGSLIKRVGICYIVYALLRYLFIDFSEHKYIGRIIAHYIVYGGYLLALYLALDIAKYGSKIPRAVLKIIGISIVIVSFYGLMQVFFDSAEISLPGLTETYGSPEEPVVTYGYGGVLIQEGCAAIKNSIVTEDPSGRIVFAGRKVFSTFHHGNIFGSHLVLFASVIFSLLCAVGRRKQKIIYFCLMVGIFLTLLFTNSRAALISFFISGLALFLISANKKKVFLMLALVLLCGGALFSLILDSAQRYNFKITSADAALYKKGVVNRYKITFSLPRLIKKKLDSRRKIVDVEQEGIDVRLNGITNYRYLEFKAFCREVFGKKNIKYLIFGRGYTGMNVYQNLYFNLLYNLGILGFSLFIYIIIYILWKVFKSGVISEPGSSIETRALAMGGISGIIGFLADNLFDNLFYFIPFGLNFWMLSGMILGASQKPDHI